MRDGRRGQLRPRLVAAILFCAAGLALGVGLLLIDWIGERAIADRQLKVAEAARDYFVAFAHEEGLGPLGRALDRREHSGPERAFRYALFSNEGQLLGGAQLADYGRLPEYGTAQVETRVNGQPVAWQVLVQPIATGGALVVYEDLSERSDFRRTLAIGAFAALFVSLGAVLAVSLWLTRLIYRRANSIAATARDICDGKVSARVPARPGGDVFDRLGLAINDMLDHSDALTTSLRTVTDSLAHDLRSPLTRMKSALAKALDPEASPAARDDSIAKASEEADNALSTTAALLDIARAESGLSREMFEPVDLGALAEEVSELFAPMVEDADQSFVFHPPASPVELQGHPVLLRQAIGNLIYNAARYAGPGAKVEVGVETAGDVVRCIVADTGPGIPEQDRERVVERFVRLDEARTSSGSGLGLAIAAACAKLHRGQLRLEDNGPGLRAVLELAR